MDGILLVDKPAGISSAGVVREVKRRLGGAKVGHLGTLDPFATGLLPLCVGEGAKIVPFLNQEHKTYEGTIRLGFATDTLDSTGARIEEAPVPPFDPARLGEIASRFTGEIEQVPPMYSAVKQGGVPLYRLARKGITVEREARRVRIESLTLAAAGGDSIDFEVRCSKGTYVRVLAAGIAAGLGSVGHLSRLRRTSFGPFNVRAAVGLDAVAPGLRLVSPREALAGLRELEVDADLERRIRLGQQRALAGLARPDPAEEVAKLVGTDGRLVAIVSGGPNGWRILRVFAASVRDASS